MHLNKRSSILIQGFLLLILLMLYIFSFTKVQSASSSLFILIIISISLLAFIFRKEPIQALKNQYIRITSFFILGYLIVYFQFHLDYVLGNISDSNIRFWVNPKIVPKSLALSAIGLVSFFLGYELTKDKLNLHQNHQYIYSTDTLSLLSSIFIILLLITINPLYFFGGYGRYEMGTIARFSSILFELTVSGLFIQHIINLNLEKRTNMSFLGYFLSIGVFQWILIGMYLLIVIASGDRGPVIYMIISFISSYVILTHWKVSLFKIAILFVLASVSISVLGAIRNNNNNLSIVTNIYEAIVNDHKPYKQLEGTTSISNSTVELAASVRCLHNTVNNVPSKDGYFLGHFQMLQLTTVIPLGKNLIQLAFNLDDYKMSSERYITHLIGGNNGSEGSCCVADLYLDFGLLGVLIGLLLFGYYVRIIETKTFSESLPSLIILCSFIIFSQYGIYIPRSAILLNIRNIVWIFLIIKFARLFTQKKLISESV